jgi:hypothetical protein
LIRCSLSVFERDTEKNNFTNAETAIGILNPQDAATNLENGDMGHGIWTVIEGRAKIPTSIS